MINYFFFRNDTCYFLHASNASSDCTHQMEKTARVERKGKNYKKLNISRTKRAEMNEIISISIVFGELLFGDKK